MKVAITGGTGFVGRHLARELVAQGHEVVLLARGVDERDPEIRSLALVKGGVNDIDSLRNAFHGCHVVAHCAGINREIGSQTYDRVHVEGTQNVVDCAREAGVEKILLLSFVLARPKCNSGYHESKWAAEEIVRSSGLDYAIFKSGVIYGKGDHLLDHISHALFTFPVFLLVGFQDHLCAPLAIEDMVKVLILAATSGAMKNETVAITGPEKMALAEVVRRIQHVVGRHPLTFRAPIWLHYCMAWFFEKTMKIPLAAFAQVRILSESVVEPYGDVSSVPAEVTPQTCFTDGQIRKGLPPRGRFSMRDCLMCSRLAKR